MILFGYMIGLGTWKLKGSSGQTAIETALKLGYRHIDTADWYKNHQQVGQAIKNSGIPREDIFLVTKIFPPLLQKRILSAGPRFLEELQTDYIDLLLVHWPDFNSVEKVLEGFQQLKDQGITKHIGVSNFSLNKMQQALDTGIEIYDHQFEIYFGNVDSQMISLCRQNSVKVTSYSPLGEGRVLQNKILQKVAEEKGITVAQAALKYLLLQDLIVIPKATSEQHLRENLEVAEIKNVSLEDFE